MAARITGIAAGERVAVVDRRFRGHRHALRLALTDPRFDAAAVTGALTVRPAARPALLRALAAPAPGGLVTAVRTAKQFLTYVASGPFQYAVAEALALP
ncbi:hypothetical protein ACWERV_22875, partial [Streptomyces sp. NPDC004031]